MDKLLVHDKFLLEKIPGKGGWTYVAIEGINPEDKGAFGMVRVKGSIGGFAIHDYNLMPMSNGNLLLPVRAEIRKKIKKQEGDYVEVMLYADTSELHVPEELLVCLEDVPAAEDFFNTLADNEKRNYITWIFAAKREETKANRIMKSIAKLSRGLRMYDKDDRQ